MNSNESLSSISPDDIIDFFKNKFKPTDNIPEDTARRDAICMEARASLLIEANCTRERFPAFMGGGKYTDKGWIFPLIPVFTTKTRIPEAYQCIELAWHFNEFRLDNSHILIDERGNMLDRWQFMIGDVVFARLPMADPKYRASVEQQSTEYNKHLDKKSQAKNCNIHDLRRSFELAQQQFNQEFRSKFELCSKTSSYNTPEKVCRFFGAPAEVFATLKSCGMWLGSFHVDAESAPTDPQMIQEHLQDCIPCSLPERKFPQFNQKYYDGWLCQVFPFRDQYGNIKMCVIKFYDVENQSKDLIPVTSWMRSNFPYSQLFCVPLPEDKQPLYNLDLLLKSENQPIILTDSVELADSNQRDARNDIVFTSFICSPECYEQVDWSPLREREVWYLVTNHSGISLEAAYLKAKELADFLQEEEGINLKYIQLKVEYPASRYFDSVDTLLNFYRTSKPEANQESLLLLENDTDFDVQYHQAVEYINSKPWWKPSQGICSEEQRLATRETNKRPRPAYLLRPFLLRGETSMLYASKSTGKSALALSMAAAVVSGEPLFTEKWWTVPSQQNYPVNKVLYLDFENGKEEIKQRKIDFASPYWPQDKKSEREKYNANLIVRDMATSAGKDYSQPENWQELLGMLENAKQQGIAGQPVDLLVIDTLTKFTRKPYTATLNLSDFINKLRSQNLAILFVHHEGDNGEVRGWKCGLDDVYFNLRLYRETDKNEKKETSPVGKINVKDLEEPLILAYQNARSSIEQIPSFEVKFVTKWLAHYPESDSSDKASEARRNAEFKRIVTNYLKKRLENQDIYPILGIGKQKYSELKRLLGIPRRIRPVTPEEQ